MKSLRKILNELKITDIKKQIEKIDDDYENYKNNLFDFELNGFKNENYVKEDKKFKK